MKQAFCIVNAAQGNQVMKPRINYRAERAERSRKKAAKKEARLAAKQGTSTETQEPQASHPVEPAESTHTAKDTD